MKSIVRKGAFALAVCMLISVCSFTLPIATAETKTYTLGDVNMNESVNTADAVVVLKYCAGLIDFTDTELKLGDVNQDEKVNTADATYILKMAAGMLPAPDVTVEVDDGNPTPAPTAEPTFTPTVEPTPTPTTEPTDEPTPTPTAEPTTPPEDVNAAITFKGDSIETDNEAVEIDGTEATITAAGTYTVTGTLNDGRLIINVTKDDKVEITFQDVNITCTYDAPLYVASADKVIITLSGDNSIKDGATYSSLSECKGAVHSNDDLTLKGDGTLTVESVAKNAIHCKDDLKITGGTITAKGAGHALRGNDSVTIKGDADVTLTAGKDGIQTDNTEDEDKGYVEISTNGTVAITAADDAIQADRLITVDKAEIIVNSAAKAFNSNGDITVSGGKITVVATTEDAMNAQDTLTVSGGEITIRDAGEDGMQGDVAVKITDGTIIMQKTGSHITADTSGKGIKSDALIEIEGGTIDLSTYEDSIHCNGNIAISGGSFTVKASAGDCIAADVDVVITGGTFNLTTTTQNQDLSLKGIKGTNSVTISEADITINTYDDAIHSDGIITIESGTYSLTSKDDGMHGDLELNINGGYIIIPSSYEGLESAKVNISGGTIYLTASDDGINAADGTSTNPGGPGGPGGGPGGGGPGGGGNVNANCQVTITGGLTVVNAGGDGIDSNGNAEMSGGILAVSGATNNGNSALDYEGKFNITGGTLIACGMRGMAQTVTSSNVAAVRFQMNSTQNAGTMIAVLTTDGAPVLVFKPAKQYNDVVIASDMLTANTQYDLYMGGSYSGGSDIGGWCEGGTYTGIRKGGFIPTTTCPTFGF